VEGLEVGGLGLTGDAQAFELGDHVHVEDDGADGGDGLEDEELLQGYTCVFKSVREIWYDVTVKHARWFYGGSNFPLLQLYWPDRNGKFPWDPKCQPEVRALQPMLHVADIEASGAAWLLP